MEFTMTMEYAAERIDTLWIPGVSLDDEYPAATPDQLATTLSRHLGARVLEMTDVLGVVRHPGDGEQIRAVASIDLCEIVRSTALSMSMTHGKEYLGNDYRSALWDDERFNSVSGRENPFLTNTIHPILQVLMNSGNIRPAEGVEEIADITARWRKNLGIYCVANTSTLSGCEVATVSFLNKHLPDSFDGIVFPRNPMGYKHQTTKSNALKSVISTLEQDGHRPEFAVHVDDSQGHHLSMIETPPHESTHVFLPEHPHFMPVDLGDAQNVTRTASSVEAFRAMDDFIKQRVNQAT